MPMCRSSTLVCRWKRRWTAWPSSLLARTLAAWSSPSSILTTLTSTESSQQHLSRGLHKLWLKTNVRGQLLLLPNMLLVLQEKDRLVSCSEMGYAWTCRILPASSLLFELKPCYSFSPSTSILFFRPHKE